MLLACFIIQLAVQRSASHTAYILRPPLPSDCSKSPGCFRANISVAVSHCVALCRTVRQLCIEPARISDDDDRRPNRIEINSLSSESHAFCTSVLLTEPALFASPGCFYGFAVIVARRCRAKRIESTAPRWNVALSRYHIAHTSFRLHPKTAEECTVTTTY